MDTRDVFDLTKFNQLSQIEVCRFQGDATPVGLVFRSPNSQQIRSAILDRMQKWYRKQSINCFDIDSDKELTGVYGQCYDGFITHIGFIFSE